MRSCPGLQQVASWPTLNFNTWLQHTCFWNPSYKLDTQSLDSMHNTGSCSLRVHSLILIDSLVALECNKALGSTFFAPIFRYRVSDVLWQGDILQSLAAYTDSQSCIFKAYMKDLYQDTHKAKTMQQEPTHFITTAITFSGTESPTCCGKAISSKVSLPTQTHRLASSKHTWNSTTKTLWR